MVKIAIAGGSGNVAREIIDVLVATKRHEILLLSRTDVTPGQSIQGVTWIKADYEDPHQLTKALHGVHTVLSFISQMDPNNKCQINLIDASVKAGVKRFAPSEWASASFDNLGWYGFKENTREYLKELNKDNKVLEYSLFVPGLFTNYYTNPYNSTKYIQPIENPIDFKNRRALIAEGSENANLTLTTVQDLANVVARAIDFEGEWPVIGGIRGDTISIGQLIALGEKLRGAPFKVEKFKVSDLESGSWTSSWIPVIDHPSVPKDQVETFSKYGAAGILLAVSAGAFNSSDEWNQLLPDYKFTQVEELLTEAWRNKP